MYKYKLAHNIKILIKIIIPATDYNIIKLVLKRDIL